jgi:hypothetical protein
MDLREQITHIVEQLPENRLEEVLRMMQLLSNDAMEIEDAWLLASGRLKDMVDAIDESPSASEDWRGHLRDL